MFRLAEPRLLGFTFDVGSEFRNSFGLLDDVTAVLFENVRYFALYMRSME